MDDHLYTISSTTINELKNLSKSDNIKALENGQVVYLPNYSFDLEDKEKVLLTPQVLKPKEKNISYTYLTNKLAGFANTVDINLLQQFMHRYTEFAFNLIISLFPLYQENLIFGRTSFRPAEIKGRKTSPRQDDTRVHVDAFVTTPVHNRRILRIFCNINPDNCPRTWELGEPLSKVISYFNNSIPPYSPIKAKLLKL